MQKVIWKLLRNIGKPKKGYICSLNFEGKKKIGSSEVKFTPFVKLINELAKA